VVKHVAHISFEGGGLVVPTQTAYEREVLFEHAEASTRRYGHIQLDTDGGRWVVSLKNRQRQTCAMCKLWLDNFTYRFGGETLCGQCARRTLPSARS
jgi:hypothetical protein